MFKNNLITIVIVSYKSKKKVLKFLNRIGNKFKIIIIENSNDLTIKREVNKNFNNVDIYFTKNIGYGNSANFARKKINSKYFFLFNPDVSGVNSHMINTFLNYAIKLNNNFSCLGPRYENVKEKSHKQSNKNLEIGCVKAISGAAMFFYTKNFDKIGGFDKNFFLYFEETDYCKRGRKINFYSYQLNKTKIKHLVGTSVEYEDDNEKNEIKKLCNWHFIWSKFYYYKKHYTFFFAIIYFIPIIVRINFRILFYTFFKDNINKDKYHIRWSGLKNSILNRKSFKRLLI